MARDYVIYVKDAESGKRRDSTTHTLESDSEAIEKVRMIRSELGDDNVYWDYADAFIQLGEGGKEVFRASSLKELHEKATLDEGWMDRITGVFDAARYRLGDVWFRFKNAVRRAVVGYDRLAEWNLDTAILNLMEHVLPRMAENLHGYPSRYGELARKAVEELRPCMYGDARARKIWVDEMGVAMWRARLLQIEHMVKLYKHYTSYCGDDDLKGDYPCPMKEFTEGLIDYGKLEELATAAQRRLFDLVYDDFGSFWD